MTIKSGAKNVVLESTAFINTLKNENSELTVTNNGYICEVTNDAAGKITASTGAIKIYTFDQLQSLALASSDNEYDFTEKTIQLQNDIDMTGKVWIPFGLNSEKAFSGTIDGNNKTIKGLSYSDSINSRIQTFSSQSAEGTPFALIAFAEKNVTIKNLTVNCDIDMENGEAVASLIGVYNNLTKKLTDTSKYETYKVELINCTCNGSIKAYHKVGGFIGTGFITLNSSFANKLLGYEQIRASVEFVFDHCVNNANLSLYRTSSGKIGGLASGLPIFDNTDTQNVGKSEIAIKNNCENNGTLTCDSTNYYGAFCGFATGSNYEIDGSSFTDNGNVGKDIYTIGTNVTWKD